MTAGEWRKARIATARADLAAISDAVTHRLELLLDGQLSAKELSRGELTALSKELLKTPASVPALPEKAP